VRSQADDGPASRWCKANRQTLLQ